MSAAAKSEWSAAIKAEDPLGFYSKASAEEVEAAREAGRHTFEANGADGAFKPNVAPDLQFLRSLCDETGHMDPDKVRATMMARPHPGGADGDGDSMPPVDMLQVKDGTVHAGKKAEMECLADNGAWRWEQTSSGGESEILVRFHLPTPVAKGDVKVSFKVQRLTVTIAGESLFDSQLYGKLYPDECTWSLVEQTASERYSSEVVHELQVLLSVAEDAKWPDLCTK